MLTKNKSTDRKHSKKNETKSIKNYIAEKLEKLSWNMGKKELKGRAELYDR